MKTIRPFPLTQHFVVTSFITTLLVALGTILLTAWLVEREVLARSEDYARRVIRHLQEDILYDFIQPTIDGVGVIDLEDPRQFDLLDSVVRRAIDAFRIEAIYIFDTSGTVVYATNREHIGQTTPSSNDLFRRARGGETVSAVRERGDPLDLDRREQVSLLETYVPVGSLANPEEVRGPEEVANVIETYLKLDLVHQEIRETQTRVALFTLGGSGVLFAVLFLIVRRADLLIRERSREVIESNDRLQELTETLEAEVDRRTDELVNKEKLASLGTLAAGIAHEVNNPLATIAGAAEGLHRRVDEARDGTAIDFEDFDSYLDMIQLEAFRVKQLTQSLLNLSRQQADEIAQMIDAGRLIHDMKELIRVGGDVAMVDVEIDPSLFGLTFSAYETSLRQVIFNVMRNAIDAIHERQQKDPAFEGGRIRWAAQVDEGRVSFECVDDGIGFAKEDGRKLLEPFFTTKPPGKGTGLGLALCHSLLERMRGTIQITSPGVNRGARVRFSFPEMTS